MGHLLYRHTLARRLIVPQIGRRVWVATPEEEAEILAQLPGMLDRVDAWDSSRACSAPSSRTSRTS